MFSLVSISETSGSTQRYANHIFHRQMLSFTVPFVLKTNTAALKIIHTQMFNSLLYFVVDVFSMVSHASLSLHVQNCFMALSFDRLSSLEDRTVHISSWYPRALNNGLCTVGTQVWLQKCLNEFEHSKLQCSISSISCMHLPGLLP